MTFMYGYLRCDCGSFDKKTGNITRKKLLDQYEEIKNFIKEVLGDG